MNRTMNPDAMLRNADSDFPALFQLFGGYFHQDWAAEHRDPRAAIDAFVHEAPPEAVRAASAELRRLADAGLDESRLARLLHEGFDCNYRPPVDGMTYAQWLAGVREWLDVRG